MIIESLELKNYRNYRELSLSFDPGTNLLYGDNAQGKTNILEALYYCASAKSHRGSKDKEIIRFGEEEAHVKLLLRKRDVPYRIDMHLKMNSTKGIAVNGLPIRRASELFGILNVVLFSPEDLNIIKNGPADRRRFMDLELCQLDRSYVHALVSYNRALVQRNRLLKDISFQPELRETLDLWDAQLVNYGSQLIRARRDFLMRLNPVIGPIHSGLTGGKEEISVIYDSNTDEQEFESSLARARESDLRQKITSVGPHRDDIGFFVKRTDAEDQSAAVPRDLRGMDLRRFGSQGQQRTAALSLKLSEIGLMEQATGESPVLLLDDVLSELDTDRQKQLLKTISRIQTVITSTGMENLLGKDFRIDRTFEVRNGAVHEADGTIVR